MVNNNCSFTDRNSSLNALANTLYSPKKELFNSLCENTHSCEIKSICDNSLLANYSSFTSCGNKGFFVTKPNDNLNAYVLDSNLNEIDKVSFNIPNQSYNKTIEDIAYDPDLNKLYVAHSNKIFSINNQGDFIKDEVTLNSINNANLACCNKINTGNNNASFNSLEFIDNNLLTTYNKNGSSFIAKVTPNGNVVNEQHIDDDITPTNIFNTSSSVNILATKNDNYQYFYTFDKTKAFNIPRENCCHIILNDECRIDLECPAFPCSLNGSLCEVIRSIALIEQGIAKIIDSESKKIKSAIDNKSCNKELIDINNSVSKTIMNISMLEQMLKEKLEVALTIYENECKKND